MATVSEELDLVTKLLRKMCRGAQSLPADVQAWWTAEQQEIAAEDAAKEARKQARIKELQGKIAELQATLDSLL